MLPIEYAETVVKELFGDVRREFEGVDDQQLAKIVRIGKQMWSKSPTGLRGATLEYILKILPTDAAEQLLTKLANR